MYFLVDNKLKIIVGWSAKCGCSHIKTIFWYLQDTTADIVIHTQKDIQNFPSDIENYTIILIIRNPFEKLISGFLDKYRKNGEFRHLWLHNTITFSKFVEEIVNNNWNVIDQHHFTMQTFECFYENVIF